jgi:hypothetical protein
MSKFETAHPSKNTKESVAAAIVLYILWEKKLCTKNGKGEMGGAEDRKGEIGEGGIAGVAYCIGPALKIL